MSEPLESMSDGFVSLDKKWNYTYVNKRAGEMFGRKPEDLVGKHIWTEFPEGIDQPFYKTYYKVIETQKQISFEDYYQPWDRWFENNVIPTKEGLAIFFQDITERKQMEEKLRKSEEQYRSFVQHSREGVYLFEFDQPFLINLPVDEQIKALFKYGYIAACNDQMAQMYGYAHEGEIVGKRLIDFYGSDDNPGNIVFLSSFIKSGYRITDAVSEEFDKDGNKKFYANNVIGIVEEGVLVRIWASQGDITDRKLASEAVKDSEEKLRKLLNNLSAGVVVHAPDTSITINNPKASELLGLSNEQLKGKQAIDPGWRFLDESNNPLPFEKYPVNQIKSTKKTIINMLAGVVRPKTNDIVWLLVNGFPIIDNQGKIIEIIINFIDITDRKKMEDALRESRAFNQTLLDTSPDLIYVYDIIDRKNIYSNHGIMKILGYSIEEILAIGENLLPDLMHPDDFNNYLENILPRYQKAVEKEIIIHEYRMKHKNGNWRWLNSKESIFMRQADGSPKQIFGLTSDITERKKAEEALFASKNKMESIFRATPTGIGVVSNRLFTEVNNRFCKISGYTKEELLGKESIIVYPTKKEFERVGKEKYEQINEKGTGTLETQFKRKDGKIIDVLLSSTPIDTNDLSKGVTFTALDITDRKNDLRELKKHRNHLEELVKERTASLAESQDALLNLVDDLNLQTAKLEKVNTQLTEINAEMETFTYSVSHDLKAPLRGIDGYSQLLLESFNEELNPEAREFLGNIRKGTRQMNLLIEDLLAYSRMERQGFQTEKVHFKPLIDNLLLHFSKIISTNKVQIKLTFPESFILVGDKDGLNLVMRNLLDNALKFTSQNKNAQIEIGGSESDSLWSIFVKDNGIGFDMKYHDRIYKIFQRLHLAEEYEGTGIGLAMVSKAVHRMNGNIRAESEPGKGTCFYFEIKK
nr:PAS domain S-box protein [Bacteroidota bacterium]